MKLRVHGPVRERPAPDARPLLSVRALVIISIAVGATVLAALRPALILPVSAGIATLTLLHKITGD